MASCLCLASKADKGYEAVSHLSLFRLVWQAEPLGIVQSFTAQAMANIVKAFSRADMADPQLFMRLKSLIVSIPQTAFDAQVKIVHSLPCTLKRQALSPAKGCRGSDLPSKILLLMLRGNSSTLCHVVKWQTAISTESRKGIMVTVLHTALNAQMQLM